MCISVVFVCFRMLKIIYSEKLINESKKIRPIYNTCTDNKLFGYKQLLIG